MCLSIDRGFVSQIHAYHGDHGVQPRKIFRNTWPCISLWENYGNRGDPRSAGNYTPPSPTAKPPDAFRQRGNDP